MKAEGGDVRVEGDGDEVEGGGGAGYPQLGVVAPAKLLHSSQTAFSLFTQSWLLMLCTDVMGIKYNLYGLHCSHSPIWVLLFHSPH